MVLLKLITRERLDVIKKLLWKCRCFSCTALFMFIMPFITCFTAQADDLNILSFETAFQTALQNNKEIEAAQETVNKSKFELKSSSRFFQDNPDLSWEVKNREKSNGEDLVDYGGSISLPVEIRGQRKLRRQKSETDIQIAELALNQKKQEIKNTLKYLFLRDYVLKKKMESLEEITTIEEALIKIMEVRTKHGESPNAELNIIKIEAAKTKEALLQTEKDLAINRQSVEMIVFEQLGKSTELQMNLPNYPTIPDLNVFLNYAGEHNFEIVEAQFEKDKTSLDYKLIKSETFMPKVSVAVTYAKDDGDHLTGGAVSIPLPFVNNKNNEVLTAEKDVAIETLVQEKIQRKVNSELQQKYLFVSNLIQRKDIYENQILPLAKENIDDMKMLYEKGEVDFLSFEKIWEQWRESNNEYLDLLQNYYQTMFSLETLSGGELKEIVIEGGK